MLDFPTVELTPWLWAGSLLVVTAITSGTSWWLVRSTRARTDAEAARAHAEKEKLRAEAATLIADASADVVETYRQELETAKAKIVGLESELELQKGYRQDLADEARKAVARLEDEVTDLEKRLAGATGRIDKLHRWIVTHTDIDDPVTQINGRH